MMGALRAFLVQPEVKALILGEFLGFYLGMGQPHSVVTLSVRTADAKCVWNNVPLTLTVLTMAKMQIQGR